MTQIVKSRWFLVGLILLIALCSLASSTPPGSGNPDDDEPRAGTPGDEPRAGTAGDEPLARSTAPAADMPAGDHPDPLSLPSNLLQIPPSVDVALVADLERNRLYVFENHGDPPTRSQDLYVAIGKKGGSKRFEGDEKTPVGVYVISSFRAARNLPAIYGAGAFPINYPNTWDRHLGRTGSGIWIHGSDKDAATLLPQSSRGCLTLVDPDFETMAEAVQLRRTPVIIGSRLTWKPAAELALLRQEIADVLEAWRRDWTSLDTDAYLAHYSNSFSTETMNRRQWDKHKRGVNARKSFIKVELSEIGIYGYPGEDDLVLVTFSQDYRSSNFNGSTWKQQFWRSEEGGWRIVHEGGF